MPVSLSDKFPRIRQPEFTGENRCIPCTVANTAIATIAAVGIGGAATATVGLAAGVALGAGAFAVFAATIYARGYLVPGTPRLTAAYVPDRVLRRFDKPQSSAPAGVSDAEAPLERAGAVIRGEHGEGMRLTDGFRESWRERLLVLREREDLRSEAATILGVDPDTLRLDDYGTSFVATADESEVGRWVSRAAFLADLAAEGVLRRRYEGWRDLAAPERDAALDELRTLVERCPSCDGSVTTAREPVEGCCGSAPLYHVATAKCRSCGALLSEVEEF